MIRWNSDERDELGARTRVLCWTLFTAVLDKKKTKKTDLIQKDSHFLQQ